MRTKILISKILFAVLALALIALGVCLIIQGVHLHQVEVAAQVAKIGYYKEDVYLDYGRHVATEICFIFGVISGICAIGSCCLIFKL